MLPQLESTAKETVPRLVADAMLGRLAHWLRLLGYDTMYWRTGSDEALISFARAEERLIVTKDHQLAGRHGVRALLVEAELLELQIEEVRAALGGQLRPFTRCPECNGLLADLVHEAARDLVPPYVWQTQSSFRRCPECGRVYWKGTHWPAMWARLSGEAP
jgi:uncharacterized protein